ncbi:molybdenum cofactor cytidylyltransferase [Enterococcus silesiacus]|nr:NTP transferase domain-containing protein [Enterococcus silesiacus]ALS01118.1 molybdenum cofactor cytidylyltransferase [Enterococcus silesiacus]
MLKVSAIIMASGSSSRMGTNKLALDYQGQTFLEHVLKLSKEMSFFERILVISPENLQNIKMPQDKTLKVIQNVEADMGQSTSVRLGTKAASGEGYLYLTVDQPLLNREVLEHLRSAYSKKTIVFPVDQKDRPYSPIYFGQVFRSELLQVTGKAGGRSVRNNHPEAWRKIQVPDTKRLVDIDTPEEYLCLLDQSLDERRKERRK